MTQKKLRKVIVSERRPIEFPHAKNRVTGECLPILQNGTEFCEYHGILKPCPDCSESDSEELAL